MSECRWRIVFFLSCFLYSSFFCLSLLHAFAGLSLNEKEQIKLIKELIKKNCPDSSSSNFIISGFWRTLDIWSAWMSTSGEGRKCRSTALRVKAAEVKSCWACTSLYLELDSWYYCLWNLQADVSWKRCHLFFLSQRKNSSSDKKDNRQWTH